MNDGEVEGGGTRASSEEDKESHAGRKGTRGVALVAWRTAVCCAESIGPQRHDASSRNRRESERERERERE